MYRMSDSDEESNERHLKLVVLGEQNVGKTNIVQKYCHDDFSRVYVPTIGADFYVKRITLSGGNRDIVVRITDVSGLVLDGQMLGTYLFKVNIVILVYDLTNKDSFDSLTVWLEKIDGILRNSHGDTGKIAIVTVGNKCDLEHRRMVRLEEANSFAHENRLYSYIISAKTGENVNYSFSDMLARYFNLPLNSLEADKQTPIIRAEITPYTPPPVDQQAKKRSLAVKRAKILKNSMLNQKNRRSSQACVMQ